MKNEKKDLATSTGSQGKSLEVPKTIKEATTGKSLSVIKAAPGGEALVHALVICEIRSLMEFYNVIRPMNDAQVIETAKIITREHYYLKIGEIKYCFNRAKAGLYHSIKVYDRLDGGIIMGFIGLYIEERDSHFIQKSVNEKHDAEADFNSVAEKMSVMLPILKKVEENLTKEKRSETEKKEGKPAISEGTVIAQEIFRVFDELFKNQGGGSGIRVVDIEGKKYTQEEYFEYRIKKQ